MKVATKLSPHFTLREMTKSSTAQRLGIDNSLDPRNEEHIPIIGALGTLCSVVLEPVRKHFGVPITPSSGYRSPELNTKIGGSSRSQHMLGQAVDFEVTGVSNLELARWIRDNLTFDQLILEHFVKGDPDAGWVHVSYVSKERNRDEVRQIGKNVSGFGLPDD